MIEIIFFISWLICGLCLECCFEDPTVLVAVIGAALVAIGCAVMMEKQRRELLREG